MPRTWLVIALAAVALLLGGWAWSSWTGGVAVEAAAAVRGPIDEYIEEEAKTRLAESYPITMPFAGRVERIELTEGQAVAAGQLVAQVVPRDLELSVAAAQAAVERLQAAIRENDDVSVESTGLEQALNYVESMDRTVEAARNRVKASEARLDYAEKNLARTRRLAETNTRTEDDVDQARVQQVEAAVSYQQDILIQRATEALQAATSLLPTLVRQYIARKALGSDVLSKQLSEAQVLLTQSQRDSERGAMRSPVDGLVLERLVSYEGHLAAGTTLLRIGRWEDLEIEADILSQEVVRLQPGCRVEVFGPAIGPIAAGATVKRVHPAGFTKVSSLGVEQQRVKVIMTFEPAELQRLREQRGLGTEFRVRVRAFTSHRDDAVTVPRSALFRGDGGQWQLYVIRNGRAELQAVQVGLANDLGAEIAEGLTAGELVVLAPETNLRPGQSVKPRVRK